MRILNHDEFRLEKDYIIQSIIDGSVFIYPTDTIYGIGCNAGLANSVKKIRELKLRTKNPFSVIAPSIEWIKENCIVGHKAGEWLGRLPGPYTLILKLKNPNCVAKNVNPGLDTLGIRIPKHWISKLSEETGTPLVTTSVNRSSEDFMTSLDDVDATILGSVDFVLYEGAKKGNPSKIIDLTEKEKVIER